MRIQITTTTAHGKTEQIDIEKSATAPVQTKAMAQGMVSISIDGVKQTGQEKINGKVVKVKKNGNNLVLEVEGEALAEVTDFFATEGATLDGAGWSFAEAALQPAALANASSTLEEGALAAAAPIFSFIPAVGAVAFGAAAASSGGDAKAVQPSTTISGTFVGGPAVTGNGLTVTLYDMAGNVLGTSKLKEDGSFSVNIGTYTGAIVAKISDKDGGVDFWDEGTGQGKDINAIYMSVDVVTTAGETLVLHINAATTIAAVKAGFNPADGSGSVAGSAAEIIATINAANAAVDKIFGQSGSITQAAVTATINQDGTANTSANEMGKILAALSGVDETNGGDMVKTINAIAKAISGSGTAATLSADAQAAVLAGAANANVTSAEVAGLLDPKAADEAKTLVIANANIQDLSATVMANLTTEQLQGLSTSQVTQLSSNQLSAIQNLDTLGAKLESLSTATVNAISSSQLGTINDLDSLGTKLESLSTATVNTITSSQLNTVTDLDNLGSNLQSLSTTSVSAISSSQLSTVADLDSLGNNLQNLSTATVVAISSSQLSTVTDLDSLGSNLQNLSTATVVAISSSQLSTVTDLDSLGANLQNLSTATVVAISSSQLSTVTDLDNLGNNLQSLSTATVNAISSSQISTVTNLDSLGNNLQSLNTATVNAISSSQLSTVTDLDSLGNNLQSLSTATVVAISSSQLSTVTDLDSLGNNLQNLSTATVNAISSSQLGTVTDLDSLGSNLQSLSTATVNAISSSQIGTVTDLGQLGDKLASLSSQTTSAISTSQVASLTGVELSLLGSNLQNLTPAVLLSLTPAQMTPELANELVKLGAVVLNELSPTALDAYNALLNSAPAPDLTQVAPQDLSPLQATKLSTSQLGGITNLDSLGSNLSVLSTATVAAISSSQLSTVADLDSLGNNLQNLSTATVTAISSNQLSTVTDLDSLGNNLQNLSTATVNAIDSVQLGTVTDLDNLGSNLQNLSTATVNAISSSQLATVTDLDSLGNNLQNLSTATVNAIDGTQIDSLATLATLGSNLSALSSAAVASIDSTQAATITSTQLTSFDSADLNNLDATALSAIDSAAITGLTAQAVATMSDAQLNALTSGQIAALQAAGDLDQLTDVQRAQLTNDATAPAIPLFTQLVNTLTVTLPEPGTTVKIFNSAADVTGQFTLTYNGNGTVTATPTGTGTFAGSELLTVKALDARGNASQATATFKVDNTAPSAPTLLSVTDNYGLTQIALYSGDTTRDWAFDDNTPTLRFSLTSTQAVDGDRIQLLNNSVAVGSAQTLTQTDIDNDYVDVTPSALYAGNYLVSAQLIDVAGNASSSSISQSGSIILTATHQLQGEPGVQVDGYYLTDPLGTDTQTLALSDGGYVIAWSAETSGSQGTDVFLQRFTADNLQTGDMQRLHGTAGSFADGRVSLTALSGGQYLIAWQSERAIGSEFDIFLQHYDASNVPGSPKVLSAPGAAANLVPKITTLSDGSYVVAWQADSTDGQGKDVFFQAYSASGTAGTVRQLGAESGNLDDGMPNITALSDGGFVIAWSAQTRASGQDVFVQRYSLAQAAVGGPVQLEGEPGLLINAEGSPHMGSSIPSVAAFTDGGYVVVWAAAITGQPSDVFVQRFDSNNDKVNPTNANVAPPPVRLQAGDYTDVWYPKVITLADDGYVVGWTGYKDDDTQWDVYLRSFNAQGVEAGNHRLNSAAQAGGPRVWDTNVQLTALVGGGYVAVWNGSPDDSAIYTKQFVGVDDATGGPLQRVSSEEGVVFDSFPAVTAMQDGGYVLTWQGDDGTSELDLYLDLYTKRFDANGLPWTGNLDRIDLATDASANTLKLALSDVLDLSGTNLFNDSNGWAGLGTTVQRHQLVVDGTSSDTVKQVAGLDWTQDGTVTNGAETYNVWNHYSSAAQLLIDSDINRVVL